MTYRSPDQRAITPQGRGRFPGYDVLSEVRWWDDVTAGVVLSRLALANDLAFFTVHETAVARPLLDLLLAQDGEPRIPVLALIDARLAMGETDGWHYDDMPEDGEAWRRTLVQLDQDAQDRHGKPFARLLPSPQAALVQAVQTIGDAGGEWHGLPAAQVWSLWTRYACTAYYSHPWAWNEIGFGGPAYPRGYKNIGLDARERWESADREDCDPIPFAQRIEDAHAARAHLVNPAEGAR